MSPRQDHDTVAEDSHGDIVADAGADVLMANLAVNRLRFVSLRVVLGMGHDGGRLQEVVPNSGSLPENWL
jgi:hypothetical protein